MQFVGSASCTQCGAPVGTAGGRCPFCGAAIAPAAEPAGGAGASSPSSPSSIAHSPALQIAPLPGPRGDEARGSQPAQIGYSPGALRYKPIEPPGVVDKHLPKRNAVVVSVWGATGGALVLALGAWLFYQARTPAPPPVVTRPAPPAASVLAAALKADPKEADPSDLYTQAFARAKAWNPEPKLLAIDAGPVVDRRVDLTAPDAKIVFTFTAARSREPGGRLLVTVTRDGTTATPQPAQPGDGKAIVAEPTCVSWAAMKAARASGIPAGDAMQARYEWEETESRPVWRTSVPGKKELDRVVDGASCAILTVKPSPTKNPLIAN